MNERYLSLEMEMNSTTENYLGERVKRRQKRNCLSKTHDKDVDFPSGTRYQYRVGLQIRDTERVVVGDIGVQKEDNVDYQISSFTIDYHKAVEESQ